MKNLLIGILSGAILFGGCARYPMGLDEESWRALPPQKRVELLAEQQRLDAKERELRERLRHEERMKALEAERLKEERLSNLYADAGFGDIVRVNISGGCVTIYKKCEKYRPVSMLLARGERKRIELKSGYSSLVLWVRYTGEGVAIDDDENLDDTDGALFLPRRWEYGRDYILSLKKPYGKDRYTVKGAQVFIRYFPIQAKAPGHCKERKPGPVLLLR